MRKLQARLPVLSEAERSMKRELEAMHEKLDTYKNSLKQVQTYIYINAFLCPVYESMGVYGFGLSVRSFIRPTSFCECNSSEFAHPIAFIFGRMIGHDV
jgi:hypothetical protein